MSSELITFWRVHHPFILYMSWFVITYAVGVWAMWHFYFRHWYNDIQDRKQDLEKRIKAREERGNK